MNLLFQLLYLAVCLVLFICLWLGFAVCMLFRVAIGEKFCLNSYELIFFSLLFLMLLQHMLLQLSVFLILEFL